MSSEDPPELDFQVFEAGKLVFESDASFSDYSTTYFLWDEADRVWVYSGDIGTFFWTKSDDGWTRSTYATSDVSAPQALKDLRPRHFE